MDVYIHMTNKMKYICMSIDVIVDNGEPVYLLLHILLTFLTDFPNSEDPVRVTVLLISVSMHAREPSETIYIVQISSKSRI